MQNGEGKYLLQMRDGVEGICNPLKWNFFGGGVVGGEKPVAAAARETQEELGIEVKQNDFELLGELRPRDDRLVYVVRYKPKLEWSDFTVKEGAGAGFFAQNELLRIDITDVTRRLAEKFLRN